MAAAGGVAGAGAEAGTTFFSTVVSAGAADGVLIANSRFTVLSGCEVSLAGLPVISSWAILLIMFKNTMKATISTATSSQRQIMLGWFLGFFRWL
jgi:hypothetical protein